MCRSTIHSLVNNDELSSFRALPVFNYIIQNTNIDPSMIKHSAGENMCRLLTMPHQKAGQRTEELKLRYITL